MKKWTAALVAAFMVLGTATGALAKAPEETPPVPPQPVELVFGEPETTITQVEGDNLLADRVVKCTWIHTKVTAYLPLGGIAYRFHHKFKWCWDGDTIISVSGRRTWVSNVGSFFYHQGLVEDEYKHYHNGNWTRYESFVQGRIDNCVPVWGCVGAYYPEITINAYADGEHTASGDAG